MLNELDKIEETIEKINRKNTYCLDIAEMELDRVTKYGELLKDKIKKIEKEKIEKTKVPENLKKVEDIFQDKKDIKFFYYNLIYFGFAGYNSGIGYLIEDKDNFFLKYKIKKEESTGFLEFEEELYVTEKKAKEVRNCDIDVF